MGLSRFGPHVAAAIADTPSVATAITRIVGYALPRVTCVVWAAPEVWR
jgi:hypothetical protein